MYYIIILVDHHSLELIRIIIKVNKIYDSLEIKRKHYVPTISCNMSVNIYFRYNVCYTIHSDSNGDKINLFIGF